MSTDGTSGKGRPNTDGPMVIGKILHGLTASLIRRTPREMSLTALSTLATLDRSGLRRITDLAAVEGVTQPSMTSLVSALERSEFVERLTDPADKRVVLVAITTRGSRYVRARRRAGAEALALLIDKLPPDELEALAAASTALEHLVDLEEQQRDSGTWQVDERPERGAR
jgi:DNA-binding MarR family transcriptional regulator